MTSRILIFAMLCMGSQAAVLTVGQANTPCPVPQYHSIGAALTAASAGDTIQVCPGLYPEQLIITKPVTLAGLNVAGPTGQSGKYGINRVLLQPTLTDMQDYPYEAVITVRNTTGVTIQNLAIDASKNTVSGCGLTLSGIHFFNSSGKAYGNAISGAQLADIQTCTGVFGNGFGILVDSDGTQPGPFNVEIERNSIHDYTKDGIYVVGAGAGTPYAAVKAGIRNNIISGIGPGSGTLQFGVFIFGALAKVTNNRISEGTCGTLNPSSDCVNLRSEGVTLRFAEAGTVVDGNTIMNAQSGIFINGGTQLTITNNVVANIEGLDGIDIQNLTNSIFDGNTLYNGYPISNDSCGIYEVTGTGVSGNIILNTTTNDAYCGVAYVAGEHVSLGSYFNTLYTEFNSDVYPSGPPSVEPGQSGGVTGSSAFRSRRNIE